MATGNEWVTVLTGAVAAAPVLVVLGTAALLTIGGIIGCAKCVLGAIGTESTEEATESARVVREPAHSH